jgi:hypothetical protein
MPVGEMLRRMDSRELSEWMAYFQLQAAPAVPAPEVIDDPAAQAAKLKAALFKAKE